MKVAVLGVGLTKFGELWETSFTELFVEAGTKAIENANIDGKDIDAIFVGNMSGGRFIDQEHISSLIADYAGLTPIPSTRVEAACASGGLAIRHAIMGIESGFYDIVVVGGVEKMTDVLTERTTQILATAAEQEWEANLGMTFPGLYAMMARRHMHEYGTTREQLALVSVKNHRNAVNNPYAQFRFEITVEDVLNSTVVAEPLRLLDCSPITDGAACLVLASEKKAKEFVDNPVYIIGSGQASSTISLHGRENIAIMDATINAAKEAYKRAGIEAKQIEVAEVHDCFTIAEILAIEGLGFVKIGKGGKATEEGLTEIGGKIPVNTSGGLKAKGHPVGATGVAQAVEITLQLRGEAEKRQVNADIGLTHNVGGSGGTAVVHIFSK
ncbi:MAG: thiolase domain-containing protein [Candidatus Hydrothermarchaeota archaeon]|nr:MAG: thiolase domain-containing protein [Candidatus Hydrothermarchaeota archaeon]